MTIEIAILRAADATAEFDLPEWMKPDDRLLIHRGDAHIDGDLLLDWKAGWQSGEFAAK